MNSKNIKKKIQKGGFHNNNLEEPSMNSKNLNKKKKFRMEDFTITTLKSLDFHHLSFVAPNEPNLP